MDSPGFKTMRDEKFYENQFRLHLRDFVAKVNPEHLLPYLTCLTEYSKEEIQAKQTLKGRSYAVQILYSNLIRRPEWWLDLTAALRDSTVNLPHLADLIDPPAAAKQTETQKKCVRKLRSRYPKEAAGTCIKQGARPYRSDTPILQLTPRVRGVLQLLDCDTTLNRNWQTLADLIGYNMKDVKNFEAHPDAGSATWAMIMDWAHSEDATLGQLVAHLRHETLERHDIVEELLQVTGPVTGIDLQDSCSEADIAVMTPDPLSSQPRGQRSAEGQGSPCPTAAHSRMLTGLQTPAVCGERSGKTKDSDQSALTANPNTFASKSDNCGPTTAVANAAFRSETLSRPAEREVESRIEVSVEPNSQTASQRCETGSACAVVLAPSIDGKRLGPSQVNELEPDRDVDTCTQIPCLQPLSLVPEAHRIVWKDTSHSQQEPATSPQIPVNSNSRGPVLPSTEKSLIDLCKVDNNSKSPGFQITDNKNTSPKLLADNKDTGLEVQALADNIDTYPTVNTYNKDHSSGLQADKKEASFVLQTDSMDAGHEVHVSVLQTGKKDTQLAPKADKTGAFPILHTDKIDTSAGPQCDNTDNKDASARPQCGNTDNKDTSPRAQCGNTDNKDAFSRPQCGNTDNKDTSARAQCGNTDNKDAFSRPQCGNTGNKGSSSRLQCGNTDNKDTSARAQCGNTDNKDSSSRAQCGNTDNKDTSPRSQCGNTDNKDACSRPQCGNTDNKDACSRPQCGNTDNKDACSRAQCGNTDNKDACSRPQCGNTDNKDASPRAQCGNTDNKDACSRAQCGKTDNKDASPRAQCGNTDNKDACSRPQCGNTDNKDSSSRPQCGNTDNKDTIPVLQTELKADNKDSCPCVELQEIAQDLVLLDQCRDMGGDTVTGPSVSRLVLAAGGITLFAALCKFVK